MKTKLFAVVFIAALSVLTAVWLGWAVDSVQAVRDFEINSNPWGVAPGQSARLSILNCGDDQGFVVNWKFLAEDHRVLKQGPEPHLVPPGTIVSFDINGDELNAPRDRFGRIQMRAVVKGLGGPDTFNRDIKVSVEVIDNTTGRSALFVSAAAVKGCSNNL